MFALIIGIDAYSHVVPKLKGAVADADRFESFLINQLKLQKDRVITLRNTEATRESIVDAFRALWECEAIQRDDPIVIFYAGHGCEMSPPKDWETGGQETIQAICPCDMNRDDSSGRAIHPIPDHTIAVWLNQLSYKKGHNIVSGQSDYYMLTSELSCFRPSFLIVVIPRVRHESQRKAYVISISMASFLVPWKGNFPRLSRLLEMSP